MDELTPMQKLIRFCAEKMAGKLAARLVPLLAGVLISHGVKIANKDNWVESTTEIVSSGILAFVTWWLTRKTTAHVEATTENVAVTIIKTDTPATPEAMAATVKSIIESKTPNGLP